MSRIKACFDALKENNKKALIPFITAGDPSPDLTVGIMHEMVAAGADIIELGVPFSDPMADGPVIQRASERALAMGTNTDDVFNIVEEFRTENNDTPIILMGYLNPIEVMGYSHFSKKATRVGVDGLIIVDLPPEESDELTSVIRPLDLDHIFLISPTTHGERLEKICEVASGFLYYVSLKGVTGSNQIDIETVSEKLAEIRSKTDLPVGVGFGISDAKIAKAVGSVCDAVVVGSALVQRIADNSENSEKMKKEIKSFIGSICEALDDI
jgi:tryptophan synthase alpha chain